LESRRRRRPGNRVEAAAAEGRPVGAGADSPRRAGGRGRRRGLVRAARIQRRRGLSSQTDCAGGSLSPGDRGQLLEPTRRCAARGRARGMLGDFRERGGTMNQDVFGVLKDKLTDLAIGYSLQLGSAELKASLTELARFPLDVALGALDAAPIAFPTAFPNP